MAYQSDARPQGPPPGTYTVQLESESQPSPVSRPGVNPADSLGPLRHESTELTLSRRGPAGLDSFSGLGGSSVSTGGVFNFQSLGGQHTTPQHAFTQAGSFPGGYERLLQQVNDQLGGLDRAHSPFLDILMRSQQAVEEPKHSSLEKELASHQQRLASQQEAERARLAFPDRSRQFASEVAMRAPLLAAYVQRNDASGKRVGGDGGNGIFQGATDLSFTALCDFIGGGSQSQAGMPPLVFGQSRERISLGLASNQSFSNPAQVGLGPARDDPDPRSRLLSFMSTQIERGPPVSWRKEPLSNSLDPSSASFTLSRQPSHGGPNHHEREARSPRLEQWQQNAAALHQQFTMLLQNEERSAASPMHNGENSSNRF
jgi:hypothetical protein